jgi:hypothetical protein
MRKCFLILMMTALLIFPSAVFAQEKISIESVTVSLWPEYDEPSMLVIDSVMLSGVAEFPVQVDLRIPATSRVHTVAVGSSSDAVSDQDINCAMQKNCSTKTDGDWLVISITATGPAVRLEYYDSALTMDDAQRSYVYRWMSDYDVANLSVSLQRPFDAAQFASSLPLQDGGVTDDIQYYLSNVGAVPAGQTLSFDLSYQKSTDALSVSHLGIKPVVVDENTPGRVSLNDFLPYIIGLLGLVVIVSGFLYYRQSGVAVSTKKSRRRRADRDENEDGVYCAQCGTRARSGDRFCRVCGSRIRQPEE